KARFPRARRTRRDAPPPILRFPGAFHRALIFTLASRLVRRERQEPRAWDRLFLWRERPWARPPSPRHEARSARPQQDRRIERTRLSVIARFSCRISHVVSPLSAVRASRSRAPIP